MTNKGRFSLISNLGTNILMHNYEESIIALQMRPKDAHNLYKRQKERLSLIVLNPFCIDLIYHKTSWSEVWPKSFKLAPEAASVDCSIYIAH